MSKSQVFAHRGASGSHFENTMSAFQAAAKKGADGIELDVQQTKDGQLVVIHDDNLLRLAGIDQQVDNLTAEELGQIRIGKGGSRFLFGHPIPILFDVISFCQQNGLSLNIELKETVYGQPAVIERILHYIEGVPDVHISSFDYPTLQLVRQQDPSVETALLLKKATVDWECLPAYDVDAFHFHKRLWKEPYLTPLLESQKTLRMYGVTGKESFLSQSPQIEGWITDYPARVQRKIKGSR
ncbi:glycerophosphodiester phosphodiesterase family protein [Mammaliicoccus sciuri]|uniref:Glycerophosphoryl diester phosphodiesterase n=1 Tax=Sporosarcina newyorkensis TaxID=759851 RepID=A0A1T4XI70_9BACL|nr:glycerophosphodiester phosphodiesterase family protein [Sporosarcina newyorkensis]SKA88801.1 glycerophosphoryl diester phosphodiesterase [Sporosarcina newyorkensis]